MSNDKPPLSLREKQKTQIENLEKKIAKLKEENVALTEEIERLSPGSAEWVKQRVARRARYNKEYNHGLFAINYGEHPFEWARDRS